MLRSEAKKKAENKDRIVVGKAGAPQGIRGDIRVIPLTDFPERFEELDYVYVDDERLDIVDVKYHKQFVLLRFKQYDVRETVASLTGKLLMIDKKDAVPLEEGEYYTFDIIGLEVFDLE
ncbi:MAG: ribosome maturation factor RimM, partial [Selenomonadales bacterium]|nr:ribosome maturation factor RimM [Selenomonadales bacterium]